MRTWKTLGGVALLVVSTAARLGAAEPGPVLFRHATLVDAGTPQLRPGMAMLVEKGRIAKVVADAEAAALVRKDMTVVDLAGAFVIPGLVDAHVHLATVPNHAQAAATLEFLVRGGVTTVRDMAGDARFLAELRREVLVGELPGPSVYYSALMAGPSFFVDARTHLSAAGETAGAVPWMAAVTDATDLREAVAQAKGTYASGIKLYANLDASLTARIVAEAKRQAFPVWAHGALFPARPSDVVATGLTSISHAVMLVYEVAPMPPARLEKRPVVDYSAVSPDDPAVARVLALMKEKQVALDATVTVFRQTAPGRTPEQASREYAWGVAVTRAARKAGVTVVSGTDYLRVPGSAEPALWTELIALQDEVGYTPAEVLASATISGYHLLGLDAELGTLVPGKRADFLVLERNPLDDIKAIRSLRTTVKGGRLYERAGYKPPAVLDNEDR